MTLCAATTGDGRLEVVGASSDEGIWHVWQVTPAGTWNGGWPELYKPVDRLRTLDVGANHATLEFKLVNPNTGETFVRARAESSYWLATWMLPSSYDTYRAVGRNTPAVDGYGLDYRINGRTYPRW
jgi:hypothetical protein